MKCIKCSKIWAEYKVQRNLVTKLSKQNKRQNVINDLKGKSEKNDIKGIWKTIKLASNIASGNNDNNNKCDINANEFNEHFCNIGPKKK